MKLKGWIYYVDCPEDWSNTSGGRNYQILDAPHVMAQNQNPKWECVECGRVISGVGLDPQNCLKCVIKEQMDKTHSTPWSYPVIGIEKLNITVENGSSYLWVK